MSTVILLHNDICEAAETDNSLDMCVLISNLVSNERQEIHSPDEYNPFAPFFTSPHPSGFCPSEFNPFASILNSPINRDSISSFNSSGDSLSNFDLEFDAEFLSDDDFDESCVFGQDTLPFSNRKKLSRTRSFFNRLFASFVAKRRKRLTRIHHKKISRGASCPFQNATFANEYLCD